MAGGHDRNGLGNRIDVREGARKLENPRQPLVERVRAQVVEFQEHVVRFRAAAAPLEYFNDH